MKQEVFTIENIPTILYGNTSTKVFLYVHGQFANKEVAKDFAQIATLKGWQVLAIDLPEHGSRHDKATFVPWAVKKELIAVMSYLKSRYQEIALRADSIGAYFSMLSFANEPLKIALFVSPILDMTLLIEDMMALAHVTKDQLEEKQEIVTDGHNKLSWSYYRYTITHPITQWSIETKILYAMGDHMTNFKTINQFVKTHNSELVIYEHGEHWFHTPKQLKALENWHYKYI